MRSAHNHKLCVRRATSQNYERRQHADVRSPVRSIGRPSTDPIRRSVLLQFPFRAKLFQKYQKAAGNLRLASLLGLLDMRLSLILFLDLAPSAVAPAQELANVVFLQPVGKVDTSRAEVRQATPLYRFADGQAKYMPWLENESARRALRLYRAGYEIAHPGGGTPDYYVAPVPEWQSCGGGL